MRMRCSPSLGITPPGNTTPAAGTISAAISCNGRKWQTLSEGKGVQRCWTPFLVYAVVLACFRVRGARERAEGGETAIGGGSSGIAAAEPDVVASARCYPPASAAAKAAVVQASA